MLGSLPLQRTWARFFSETSTAQPVAKARSDRYRIDSIAALRGQPHPGLEVGSILVRVESELEVQSKVGDLVGVTQHLAYTQAAESRELTGISAAECGPLAVLIPIVKSAEWWALAQDERDATFRGKREGPGHMTIGKPYASRIYRKLYHARYLAASSWDFLTYFEFPVERADDFRALLAELRDPNLNPEWQFVERETEIWLTKLF